MFRCYLLYRLSIRVTALCWFECIDLLVLKVLGPSQFERHVHNSPFELRTHIWNNHQLITGMICIYIGHSRQVPWDRNKITTYLKLNEAMAQCKTDIFHWRQTWQHSLDISYIRFYYRIRSFRTHPRTLHTSIIHIPLFGNATYHILGMYHHSCIWHSQFGSWSIAWSMGRDGNLQHIQDKVFTHHAVPDGKHRNVQGSPYRMGCTFQ